MNKLNNMIDITTGRNIIYSQINSNTYRYYSLSEGDSGKIEEEHFMEIGNLNYNKIYLDILKCL